MPEDERDYLNELNEQAVEAHSKKEDIEHNLETLAEELAELKQQKTELAAQVCGELARATGDSITL